MKRCVLPMSLTHLLVRVANLALIASESGRAQTWTETGSPSNLWSAVACSADGSRLLAATGGQFVNGQLYISTDSGTNWALTGPSSMRWTSVASSADGTKQIAAAYDRGIYT